MTNKVIPNFPALPYQWPSPEETEQNLRDYIHALEDELDAVSTVMRAAQYGRCDAGVCEKSEVIKDILKLVDKSYIYERWCVGEGLERMEWSCQCGKHAEHKTDIKHEDYCVIGKIVELIGE